MGYIYYILTAKTIKMSIQNWGKPVTYFDMVYFSTATITTIGYGDITPSSTLAKCLVLFNMLCVVIVPILAAA